jgi:hypothetical protein
MGTLEKSSYAPTKRAAMLQYVTFLHIRTFPADGLVIILIVPNLRKRNSLLIYSDFYFSFLS